jgi:ATP-dependent Lon protease
MPANIDKKLSSKKTRNKKESSKMKLRKSTDSDSESSEEVEWESESDSTYEPPKKHRKHEEEDIEETEDDDEDSDEESDEESEEEGPSISRGEIQKLVSKMFPSKYMNKRAKTTDKLEQKYTSKKNTDKSRSSKGKHKKSRKHESSSEEEYDDDSEEYEDEDAGDGFYNILLVDGQGDEDDEEYNEDDDDVECDSEDEKTFMKENYQELALPDNEKKKKNKKSKKQTKQKDTTEEEVELADAEKDYLELIDLKNTTLKKLNNNPKSKVLLKAIKGYDESIKDLVKNTRVTNAKNYHKLIHADKKQTNEIDYFKKKLSNKEQLTVMKHLKEINSHTNIEKPYRLALLDTNMPAKFKAVAMQKLSMLKSMEVGDNEYFKVKNWVDTFMRIPFGIYRNLSISMADGIDACHEYMDNAITTLDNCVYGLNDAKLQIMQMVGQWISNPSAMGTAIAIKGPMGTGKTTLVKEGISKILGRDFAFIALGGTGDSSFLEGHSYTYEGSSWGKIVQTLIDSKSMNPVIYFDELDKVSDTPRGEEIIGILTHLTDTSQNSEFHDKYFSEVNFDLSKCLFIFSYNDESKVNPILRDRMYRIQTKGYDAAEKVIISRKYLLPKIREQVNFNEEDVIIPDETIKHIVSCENITKNEDGVRNLKRCLEIIHTKLNLFRLMKKDTPLFDKDIKLDVSFPFTVNPKEADILIKNDQQQNQSFLAMYV